MQNEAAFLNKVPSWKNMTSEWERRILELRYRDSEKDDLEFVNLVDKAENHCDLDTCEILMKTFVTEEDFGIQESVNRVLSSASPENRQKALLTELPRLIADTPGWAYVLVETEVRFHLNELKQTLGNASAEQKKAIDQILKQESFRRHFPNLNL